MNNRKVDRWLIAIIASVLVLCVCLGLGACAANANTEPVIEATVPIETDFPEGEPIITEDPTEPPTLMGTVNTDRLNVRKEPDMNAHVFKQLAVGTRVEILEGKILDAVPWGRIDDGWINMRYVTIDGEPEPTQ